MERAGEGDTTSLDSCANHALLWLTGKFFSTKANIPVSSTRILTCAKSWFVSPNSCSRAASVNHTKLIPSLHENTHTCRWISQRNMLIWIVYGVDLLSNRCNFLGISLYCLRNDWHFTTSAGRDLGAKSDTTHSTTVMCHQPHQTEDDILAWIDSFTPTEMGA